MIHLQHFASLLGFANWFDVEMFKLHGEFMQTFREDDFISRDLAEYYIEAEGLGSFFTIREPALHAPTKCCISGVRKVCLQRAQELRMLKTISKLSEIQDPVSEALIWHDIFLQTDSCHLKNHSPYQYALYKLQRSKKIIRIIDVNSNIFYTLNRTPEKRKPGRPRKNPVKF